MTQKQLEVFKQLIEWEMCDKKDRGLGSAQIDTSDDYPDADEWEGIKIPCVFVSIWPDNLKAKRYTYRNTGRAIFRILRLIQIVEESERCENEHIEVKVMCPGNAECVIDEDGPNTDENLASFDIIQFHIS